MLLAPAGSIRQRPYLQQIPPARIPDSLRTACIRFIIVSDQYCCLRNVFRAGGTRLLNGFQTAINAFPCKVRPADQGKLAKTADFTLVGIRFPVPLEAIDASRRPLTWFRTRVKTSKTTGFTLVETCSGV